jgi:DNA-binding NarL/FixJ family response regulator
VLSDRQRQIVDLIDRLGVDHDDIAEELDLSPSTVRDVITRLCFKFNCTPARLPAAVGLTDEAREA